MSCPPLGASCESLDQSQHPPQPSIKADQARTSPVPIKRCTYLDDSFDGLCITKYLAFDCVQPRHLIKTLNKKFFATSKCFTIEKSKKKIS